MPSDPIAVVFAEALDEANRLRQRAIETGHEADHVVADYAVARVHQVVETERMIQRARERLERR